MTKKNYVSLILTTIGGLLFAIGMCMGLIPEWNAFNQGVVLGVIGIVILVMMLIVRRKMEGKPAVSLNKKAVVTVLFGIIGALVLGVGFCMVSVWNRLVPGILIGLVGIVLLLLLIPMVKGLK